MEFVKLKFPPYEWLEALPLETKIIVIDRSGDRHEEDSYKEYYFTLFDTPTSVYGRLAYNEGGDGFIVFDVIEDGDRTYSNLSKALPFNKKNYETICEHAQEVYEYFQRSLFKDLSWQWKCNPEDYAPF